MKRTTTEQFVNIIEKLAKRVLGDKNSITVSSREVSAIYVSEIATESFKDSQDRWNKTVQIMKKFKQGLGSLIKNTERKYLGKKRRDEEIYSISLTSKEKSNLGEIIRKNLGGKEPKEVSKVDTSVAAKSLEKSTTTATAGKYTKKISGYRPQKKTVNKIFEVLSASLECGGKLDLKEVRKICGFADSMAPSMIKKGWIDVMRDKLGIDSFDINTKRRSHGADFEFSNVEETLTALGSRYKDVYGEDLGVEKVLKLKTSSSTTPTTTSTTVTSPSKDSEKVIDVVGLKTTDSSSTETKAEEKKDPVCDKDFNTAYLLYLIAAICRDKKTAVSLFDLTATLKNKCKVTLTNSELLEIIKDKLSHFTYDKARNVLGIKSDGDWEILKDTYHPKKFKTHCIARIKMTAEEISGISPELSVRTVTSFTSRDRVYEITYDRSMNGFKALVRLYRTFRGRKDELIIDNPSLVEKLESDIQKEDKAFYNNIPIYEIETIK